MPHPDLPRTLGALRASRFFEHLLPDRTLKEELRSNLLCKLSRNETLFPGIMGFDDTVVPQVVNAILSRHNFILLGLRGQAKTRMARMLTRLLDPWMPYVARACFCFATECFAVFLWSSARRRDWHGIALHGLAGSATLLFAMSR